MEWTQDSPAFVNVVYRVETNPNHYIIIIEWRMYSYVLGLVNLDHVMFAPHLLRSDMASNLGLTVHRACLWQLSISSFCHVHSLQLLPLHIPTLLISTLHSTVVPANTAPGQYCVWITASGSLHTLLHIYTYIHTQGKAPYCNEVLKTTQATSLVWIGRAYFDWREKVYTVKDKKKLKILLTDSVS